MIVVLGSINADVVLRVPHLPAPGETLRASDAARYPGGKGANQADGTDVLGALRGEGIDVSAVAVDEDAPTGRALITVAADGTNTIVTSGGSNHRVGEQELRELEHAIRGASMLLVQLEVPMRVVQDAVSIAARAGVAVMLDPAPVTNVPDGM